MEATGATLIKRRLLDEIGDTGGPNARLAELVVHLTDCQPTAALAAVNAAAGDAVLESHDDRLGVVAAALLSVRRRIDLRETHDPR